MYDLDVKAARSADTDSASIKEPGKYTGTITQAKALVSKNTGAKGIEFAFKAQNGQKANLSIYTMSASGEHYQGYNTLMSIMACMGLRTIKPVFGKATKYDFDSKKEVQEECEIFLELCKPIGVLLESEDYLKQSGEVGTRMVLKHVFQASTELVASEILERKTLPEMLPKMVEGLRHRPLKTAAPKPTYRQSSPQDGPPAGHPASAPSGFETMDDDIPF